MSIITQDRKVETLRHLGLSNVQARTYLNLAKLGTADIKTIATSAGIARQDTYRVMFTLEKIGLVEKIIAPTTMYSATPIMEGLGRLLENKKRDYVETQKQVVTEFENFLERSKEENDLHGEVKFTITSDLTLLYDTHTKLCDNSTKSIDMTLPLKINRSTLLKEFNYIKPAIKRGVKLRVLTYRPREKTRIRRTRARSPARLLELRCLPEKSVFFGMHIFDGKMVTLAVSEGKPLPSLWTNSPHVAKLAATFFEALWDQAAIEP